jgi:hypothetical protein
VIVVQSRVLCPIVTQSKPCKKNRSSWDQKRRCRLSKRDQEVWCQFEVWSSAISENKQVKGDVTQDSHSCLYLLERSESRRVLGLTKPNSAPF